MSERRLAPEFLWDPLGEAELLFAGLRNRNMPYCREQETISRLFGLSHTEHTTHEVSGVVDGERLTIHLEWFDPYLFGRKRNSYQKLKVTREEILPEGTTTQAYFEITKVDSQTGVVSIVDSTSRCVDENLNIGYLCDEFSPGSLRHEAASQELAICISDMAAVLGQTET